MRSLRAAIAAYNFKGMDIEEKRRRRLLLFIIVVGIFPLAIFGSDDLMSGNFVEAMIEYSIGCWMIFCLVMLTSRGGVHWIYNSMTAMLFALFLFLAVDGDVEGSKIYWSFLIPVFTFYIHGNRRGMPWVLVYMICAAAIVLNPGRRLAVYDYPRQGAVRFMAVFMLMAVLSYIYESVRQRTQTILRREKDKLSAAHQEIKLANVNLHMASEDAKRLAREADSANLAKSHFLANMSHEIRTPMNGVIGMTNLLMDTELNEEQKEFTKIIQHSGESLLNIINNILDYSKIEAGKLEIETIDFDLRVAIDKMADLLAVKAQEKGLEFVSMIHYEVPSLLRGDPGRLRQILMNLVGNSIKFTDKGEVAIRVSLEDEDETHATIRFGVTDTGIGIPEDRLDRLFKSFSQADTSTTRRYGGTGLGLAISKKLSELMGGRIGVNSEDGKGSEFWFSVIFEKQPFKKEPTAIIPESLKDRRILIVDHNPTSRYALREQLKAWGCRYDEASGSLEALEKLREAAAGGDRFEIAVLNMQMPEMSGEILGQAIKGDSDLQQTILVMMTSIGDRGDAGRLKEIGFAAYLTKPIKQSQLYNCLTTVTGVPRQPLEEKEETLVTRHSLEEQQKRRFRILLVEDNSINQKVAVKILTKLGYSTDVVENGREAMEMLKENRYHLVLMDCQMPVMDGYEATAEIRNPESDVLDHDIPVIAMTAHAMKGDREKCLDAGMSDYLTKPVKPRELSRILKKWMQN